MKTVKVRLNEGENNKIATIINENKIEFILSKL
jgi:predicted DNA-binding antitoxin AbrB/MazE fold protein